MPLNILLREKQVKCTILGLFGAVLLYFMGNFPVFVEKWYALGFYPLLSKLLRMGLGWLPFSVGDLIYLVLGGWILVFLARGIRTIYTKGINSQGIFLFIGKLIRFFSWGFIVFQICWGLNYSRLGIAHQLGIQKKGYTKEEVTALTRELIFKTNAYRSQLKDSSLPIMDMDSIVVEAANAYSIAAKQYSFMQYAYPALKTSLFTTWADYIGFSGYYAPLTGEAQIRTDIPRILLPYIACHEIGHQLGYASESEANFVGYLAASASSNPYFKYSVYLDLLGYALGEEFVQFAKDSSNFTAYQLILQNHYSHIDSLVKKDRKAIRQFFMQRRNAFSPVTASLYNQFLLFNKQLAGMHSYDEVIGWLISYQKKQGRL